MPKSYGKLRSQNKKKRPSIVHLNTVRVQHTPRWWGEKERELERENAKWSCVVGSRRRKVTDSRQQHAFPPCLPLLRFAQSAVSLANTERRWCGGKRHVWSLRCFVRSAAAVCCRSSPPLFCGHLTRDGMVFSPLSESGWDWSAAVLGPDFSFEGRGSKDTTSEGQTDGKPI